jgi:uncharacterized protein YbjT (DUF2867 family)
MTTILILGATGLVGKQILALALENKNLSRIVAPTRQALANHPKLDNPIVNYAQLPADAPWWKADAVLCALGTTMRTAGSNEAFYRVDHDYVLDAARLAKAAGTPCFVLNSSTGSKLDAGSFYLRVKAETERDLAALNFTSFTSVRPSILDGGKRPEKRHGEALAIMLAKLLGPLIPKRLRPISTEKVARAMLNAGMSAHAGSTIIESEQLQ